MNEQASLASLESYVQLCATMCKVLPGGAVSRNPMLAAWIFPHDDGYDDNDNSIVITTDIIMSHLDPRGPHFLAGALCPLSHWHVT